MIKDREYVEREYKKNIGLVYSVLKRHMHLTKYHEFEDLFQIGSIGLVNAIKSFEDDGRATFGTFASRCIFNELFKHDERHNFNSVKVSRLSRKKFFEYNKLKSTHTIEEIADKLGMKVFALRDLILAMDTNVELDKPYLGEEDMTYQDILEDENAINDSTILNNIVLSKVLRAMKEELGEEKYTLYMTHIISGKSQIDTGKDFGVSNKVVWRLVKKVEEKIIPSIMEDNNF